MAAIDRPSPQTPQNRADDADLRLLMLSASLTTITLLALFFGVTGCLGWMMFMTTPDDQYRAAKWCEAAIWAQFNPDASMAIAIPGDRRALFVRVGSAVADPYFTSARDLIEQEVLRGSWVGIGAAIAEFLGALAVFRWKGEALRRSKLLRGNTVAPVKDVARVLRKSAAELSDLRLAGLPMIKDFEVQHTLISGAPGVGKSVMMMSIADQIRQRGEAAIVYDKTGDYVRYFFDYDAGDIILNPLDARSPAWTPWGEIAHDADADRIAASLIPSASHDAFWTDAGRTVVSSLLTKLWETDQETIGDVLNYLLRSPAEELAEFLQDTDARALFADGAERMTASIRGTMATYARALRFLNPTAKTTESFSFRDWHREVETLNAKKKPWVFLTSKDDMHNAIRPLLSTWLDCAATGLLSLPQDPSRRRWFLLDELPTLNATPSVPSLLAEGRKFGAACVLGIQSISQIRDTFGHDRAETIIGVCSTQIAFRAPNADTAEWISKSFGQREMEEVRESVRYAAGNAQDAINMAVHHETKPVVMPSEIMQIPNLRCFIRLAGPYPIARAALKWKARKEIAAIHQPTSTTRPPKRVLSKPSAPIVAGSGKTPERELALTLESESPVPSDPVIADADIGDPARSNTVPLCVLKTGERAPLSDANAPRGPHGIPATPSPTAASDRSPLDDPKWSVLSTPQITANPDSLGDSGA